MVHRSDRAGQARLLAPSKERNDEKDDLVYCCNAGLSRDGCIAGIGAWHEPV